MDIFVKNRLPILAFIVALFGGVPGIIAAINQVRNRPIFAFSLSNIISGEIDEQLDRAAKNRSTMLVLSGTASNKGNSVLSPACFELECRIKRSWVKLDKTLIPDNAQFLSQIQNIHVDAPAKRDLQRFNGAITTGLPLNGHLMFVSREISLEQLREIPKLRMRLICRDIFDKSHKALLEVDNRQIDTDTTYPKHGLRITPKT
jgi:hypothetical protein